MFQKKNYEFALFYFKFFTYRNVLADNEREKQNELFFTNVLVTVIDSNLRTDFLPTTTFFKSKMQVNNNLCLNGISFLIS